ncbi:MAG TPA: holo-ACP synthase [Actinomycetota bacterium]|jgi:holo-[acyl-carrier protein] synthase|nr:holo-ACP synthase [Actinomycetota bacterium]
MRILGVGVDVVEVGRVQRILDRRSTFRDRVFTSDEIAYCERKAVPARYYAARWAAREACVKALGGVPALRWKDIEVVRTPSGAPHLALEGSAKAKADRLGAHQVLVSFSHEGSVATAFCIAVGE